MPRNNSNNLFIKSIFIAALMLSSVSIPRADARECTYGPYTGRCRDIGLMRSVKRDAEKRASARSILWVEAGYLSADEASDLHQKIDAGVEAVEKFLGFKFSREAYGQEKIEFFVHSRRAPSHTITAYSPRKYMHPVVFLFYAKGKRTPYLHETVHIIAWDWNTLWLKEGLAVHLNDRLGGYAAFPNFGESVDEFAGRVLRREFPPATNALDLVGENGIPRFENRAVRRMFYILSGSYVAYLLREWGVKKFMRVYAAKDAEATILKETGKPAWQWKETWLGGLR
ncbi:MAG: hypothetical protein OXE44_12090 [Nitrospinae bacterium]|nr:hypothetical protein [Nitrospinota bacterium]